MNLETSREVLQKYWGYSDFRESQVPVVKNLIAGKSTLAILTTGGGKSICYQVPGLLLPGLTVVISPLLSLIKDQVARLSSIGVVAREYSSILSSRERKSVLERVANGQVKFLYLSPESFSSKPVIQALTAIKTSQVAIDEAHCISTWGHDFRPSYRKIRSGINQLPESTNLLVSAFTATATPKVRRDICLQLRIPQQNTVTTSFRRENLALNVRKNLTTAKVISLVKAELKYGDAICYTSTRARAEELASQFLHDEIPTAAYHGGLDPKERSAIQERFMASSYRVIAATNAFGMGVDKANIRCVIHEKIPDSLENYFQEAGRAGRNGADAIAILNFDWIGVNQRQKFSDNSTVSTEVANQVYDHCLAIVDKTKRVQFEEEELLMASSGLNSAKLANCCELFYKKGVISAPVVNSGKYEFYLSRPGLISLHSALDLRAQVSKKNRERENLVALVRYCKSKNCRMQTITNHFGESTPPCGKCDNCLNLN